MTTDTAQHQELEDELRVLQEAVGYDPAESPATPRNAAAYVAALEQLTGDLVAELAVGGAMLHGVLAGLQREDLKDELYDDPEDTGASCTICGGLPRTRGARSGAIWPAYFCAAFDERCVGRVAVVCHPEDVEYLDGWRRKLPDDVIVLPARTPTGQRYAITAARQMGVDALWHLTYTGGAWRRLRLEAAS